MSDAFEQLESTKTNVGGGSVDYAEWWNNKNFNIDEGDTLVGVVVETHDYTDPGDDDHPVAGVRSIGKDAGSHLEKGIEASTPTRKGIEPFAEDLTPGDLVLIEYGGEVPTDSGRNMHIYEASKLTQDEWQDTNQAELIQEVWDNSPHSAAEPKTADGGVTQVDQSSSDVPEDAINFALDTVDINGGEVSVDELDEYLNEIRDYGVDVENVVDATDELEMDEDTVMA